MLKHWTVFFISIRYCEFTNIRRSDFKVYTTSVYNNISLCSYNYSLEFCCVNEKFNFKEKNENIMQLTAQLNDAMKEMVDIMGNCKAAQLLVKQNKWRGLFLFFFEGGCAAPV